MALNEISAIDRNQIMTLSKLVLHSLGIALITVATSTATAWDGPCGSCSSCGSCASDYCGQGCGGCGDCAARHPDGSLMVQCIGKHKYPPAPARFAAAVKDHYSPAPFYAYGKHGLDATRTHAWNINQMNAYPWHGNYYHRQYGTPLALVVPPTAAYQTVYNWGVAQTQSVPINHQFQKPFPGSFGSGAGMFNATPYWPSSTEQFGVYPVRGPW